MGSMELVTAFITTNIMFLSLSILLVLISIMIFLLPFFIAKRKNIKGDDFLKINILMWLGILCVPVWFVALFLSLSYERRI